MQAPAHHDSSLPSEQYFSSEDYRRRCEAREILTWPLDMRRKHIAKVETTRGKKAASQLKQDITQEWERQKHESA